jgi:predicted PurR-regulated permease PerM
VLGAPVVWFPACRILFMTGHWINGSVIAMWGIAVVHPVDNLLYPVLVGGRLGLRPMALFVAFVGGSIVFGPAGLILGPCVVAIAAGIGDVWLTRINIFTEEASN